MTTQNSKSELKNRAYQFSVDTIRFVEEVRSEKQVYYAMVDQLIRSSTSIGANIIEAKAASSKKDFIRFFEIALKSSNETKYWLCLFRDALSCNKIKVIQLLKEADEISKMLAKSIITMKSIK
jgi:four helix bundle protein